MRPQHTDILTGFFHNDESESKTLKIVQDFREEYKRVDEYLNKHPEILELAHRDLQKLCKPNPKKDRTPDFTSDNLFHAVLVMQIEALDYRETTIRIAESKTLQNFADYSTKRRSTTRSSATLSKPSRRTLGKPSTNTSASEEVFPPVLKNYYKNLGRTAIAQKTRFHELIPFMKADEVDKEIRDVLDEIHRTAETAIKKGDDA
ncbi:MAG: hypothetical protein FWE95_01305 [Planctomycetaceae bacterium]|nr:hypothetical protein [Planctomycetaceae bacterium]